MNLYDLMLKVLDKEKVIVSQVIIAVNYIGRNGDCYPDIILLEVTILLTGFLIKKLATIACLHHEMPWHAIFVTKVFLKSAILTLDALACCVFAGSRQKCASTDSCTILASFLPMEAMAREEGVQFATLSCVKNL